MIRSFQCSAPLKGILNFPKDIPGDKSISHRALILASFTEGSCRITGLNKGEDVRRTALALKSLGVQIQDVDETTCMVTCPKSLELSKTSLYMGNSGTSARLICGVLAGLPGESMLLGDLSLQRRPMDRVTFPLSQMGANFKPLGPHSFPLYIYGKRKLEAMSYTLPQPSAQVKSAILLAGLRAEGTTTLVEPEPTRDHTERLLRYMGADLTCSDVEGGGKQIGLLGGQTLYARPIEIPGDPSAAAFFAVAALIVPHSEIRLNTIGWNPFRNKIFHVLKEMGGDISWSNERELCGEPVVDLTIRSSSLKGIEISEDLVPQLIDEYPILAIAAVYAKGESLFHGLKELRVKESDRLNAVKTNLEKNGIEALIQGDTLIIYGTGGEKIKGGALVEANLDHRIAMSFLILGLNAIKDVPVKGCETILTSNPSFFKTFKNFGVSVV